MTSAILRIEKLSKRYGGLAANTDIDLTLTKGEIHAVIGPNGAGKTTFIKQIAGEIYPTSGRIYMHDEEITRMKQHMRAKRGLARSYQITSIFPSFTVLDNVAFAAQAAAGHGFHFWRSAQAFEALNTRAMDALCAAGLQHRSNDVSGSMSHGEHRQLEMAMALATAPKLMLLDEPTAGMGREESLRFVSLLKALREGRTILLVEHDMDVVFALADRITVLANGRVIATDVPEAIRKSAVVRDAYLGNSMEA